MCFKKTLLLLLSDVSLLSCIVSGCVLVASFVPFDFSTQEGLELVVGVPSLLLVPAKAEIV